MTRWTVAVPCVCSWLAACGGGGHGEATDAGDPAGDAADTNGAVGELALLAAVPVGPTATLVAAGDLDEDGLADLVVAHNPPADVSGMSFVAVLLATGPLTFADPVRYDVGPRAITSMQIGDFDGDGHQDVVVVDDTAVLPGHGEAGLDALVTLPVRPADRTPGSLAAGDLDRDGRPDLAQLVRNGEQYGIDLLFTSLAQNYLEPWASLDNHQYYATEFGAGLVLPAHTSSILSYGYYQYLDPDFVEDAPTQILRFDLRLEPTPTLSEPMPLLLPGVPTAMGTCDLDGDARGDLVIGVHGGPGAGAVAAVPVPATGAGWPYAGPNDMPSVATDIAPSFVICGEGNAGITVVLPYASHPEAAGVAAPDSDQLRQWAPGQIGARANLLDVWRDGSTESLRVGEADTGGRVRSIAPVNVDLSDPEAEIAVLVDSQGSLRVAIFDLLPGLGAAPSGDAGLDAGPHVADAGDAEGGEGDASVDAAGAGDDAAIDGATDTGDDASACSTYLGTCGAAGGTCCGGAGLVCDVSTCRCPAGQAFCDGACIDTLSDPLNCGDCGYDCTISGPDYLCCDGFCSYPLSHDRCGSCTTVCGDDQRCCPQGGLHCETIDVDHCQSCGEPCPPGDSTCRILTGGAEPYGACYP